MKVYEYLKNKSAEKTLHLTLIDPDKQSPEKAAEIARASYEGGTDGIMVGGSVGISSLNLDATIEAMKKVVKLPVILFPGDITGISSKADAIFFMSLLNSRNTYYLIGAQMLGAPIVKRLGIEAIPMGYIVVEPGCAVGFVADAKLIPRDNPKLACAYALAAQYLGMKLVYLEAGSGAKEHVPEEMIAQVKKSIDIPLIVGGGIKTGEDARRVAKAGADIIVTGTVIEKAENVRKKVEEITSSLVYQ